MSNNIRSIVEDKIASYIASNLTGVTVHKGVTDEIRTIPLVICHASDSNKPNSLGAHSFGNYRVTLKVYVYSSADDETLQTHRDRVAQVTGLLDAAAAVKTAWGDAATYGSLYDLWFDSDSEGMANRRYGNVLSYTIYASLPPSLD